MHSSHPPSKTFKDAVRTRDFALTAEIRLQPETDATSLCEQAALLQEHVDAILLTDNQYGQLHMSTIAAASLLLAAGIDPVVQLTCRNRNRIALISELLGAAAIGVTSLLLLAGERAPAELKPRPKPVLDLTATDLIRTAATLKSDERLNHCPDFLIGGVITPLIPKPSWKATKMTEKVEAGAQFLQTHVCMDTRVLSAYMEFLVTHKYIGRTSIMGSVVVLESAEDALWLRENRPNVNIPDQVVERLRRASDPRVEGIHICAETLRAIAGTPGMVGANIIASRSLESIPEVVSEAGLA